MKKRKRIGFFALLFSILFVSTFFAMSSMYHTHAAADSTVQGYEDRLAQLEKDQKALKDKISQTKSESASISAQKSLIDNEMSLLNEQIELSNALIAEYDAQIEATEKDIALREEAIEAKSKELEERMVYYYKNRNLNYLSVLFRSESLSDFVLRLQRISSLLKFDNQKMKEMNAAKSDLSLITSQLALSKERQGEIKAALLEKEKEAQERADEAIALINRLANQTSSYQAEINKLAKEQADVDKQLEQYLAELARQSQSAYIGGSMTWPTKLANNRLTSYYGWRDLWGTKDFHYGIDIAAPNLDPIYAANDGTVVNPPTHWSYGNCLLIDHGGGIATLYAHCSTLLVKVGEKVTRGQQIAKVGLTGNTSGYHLHFEVRVNGKTTNPLDGYVVVP